MPDVSAPRSVGATADALAHRALDALPATVGRADLDALAPPLGRLLEARLDQAVDQATAASPWVDTEDWRVASAQRAWRAAVEGAVRIPAAEREAEVRQAAHRALSHLVRPADTMAAVAFEGHAAPLPAHVALGRIRTFGPYPYLPQIAERYVERKGLGHIDRAGLERLLRRIDRRMVSTFGADDWLALLAPLIDWVGPAGSPPGTVPSALLRPLFLAKGADDLHDALDHTDAVDAGTLRSLVAETLSETSTLSGPSALAEPPAPAGAPAETPAAETGTGDRQPEPDPSDPASSESSATHPSGSDPSEDPEPGPPVIGSRYGTPEFEPVHESEVLGPPRPVVTPDHATDGDQTETAGPMDDVRDAVARPSPEPPPHHAPLVPVLDLSPPSAPPNDDAPADAVPGQSAPADPGLAPPADENGPDEDDEPLWQRLARTQDAAPPPPGPDEDTPLWKRFAQSDLAERLPDTVDDGDTPVALSAGGPAAGSLDGLEARVLGDGARERRDWFVAELFGGSDADYHRTLEAIDRAPTYTDATAVISAEVLRKRSVSPYTDGAVAFIDAVQAGFERR